MPCPTTSKRPLHRQRRIPFEAIHHSEVRGDLPLCADTQVETVVNMLELIQVNPELWLGQENPLM